MTLGEKIRVLRQGAGLSQAELAQKLCVSRAAVAKWENDNGLPDVENLRGLATYFSCNMDTLLDETKDLEKNTSCGKVCSTCGYKLDGSCHGCAEGPDGLCRMKCRIALCCKEHNQTTCGNCTLHTHCGLFRDRERMPQLQLEQETQQRADRERRKELASQVWLWAWLLFWLSIASVVLNVIFNDNILRYIPTMRIIGYTLTVLVTVGTGLILLRLSKVDRRFLLSGLCMLLCGGLNVVLFIGTKESTLAVLPLLTQGAILVLDIYRAYLEFGSFSTLMEKFDLDQAEKWRKLRVLYILSYVSMLCGLVLAMVIDLLGLMIAGLGLIGFLIASVKLIIRRLQTAMIMSQNYG